MGNVFDYLDWRGDIPFSVDPFNEVDNLILAELVYTNFADLPEDGAITSLQDACTAYFSNVSPEADGSGNSNIRKAKLMESMLHGGRFRNTKILGYVSECDPEENIQFAAATFLLDDGSAYAAFRGTDSSFTGWKESLDLSYLPEIGSQRKAIKYLNDLARLPERPIRVGGHSKGGNLAIYGAAFCDPAIQDRIINIYSNDSPGFKEEFLQTENYQKILPKITRIIPGGSVIGRLLSNRSVPIVVLSNASGIGQHDAFSWQIKRNRFEQTMTSEIGNILDKTIEDWEEQTDRETKRSIIRSIFSLLESTGADNFQEIREQKRKSLEAILMRLNTLPQEKRQKLLQSLQIFFRISGQAAKAEFTALLENEMQKKSPEPDPETTEKLAAAFRAIEEARKRL